MSSECFLLKPKDVLLTNELNINKKIKKYPSLLPFVNLLEEHGDLNFKSSNFYYKKNSNFTIVKYNFNTLSDFSSTLQSLSNRKKYFFLIESFYTGLRFLNNLHNSNILLLNINLKSVLFDNNYLMYFSDFSKSVDISKLNMGKILKYSPYIYQLALSKERLESLNIEETEFTLYQNIVLAQKVQTFIDKMNEYKLEDRSNIIKEIVKNWDIINLFTIFLKVQFNHNIHKEFIGQFIDFYLSHLSFENKMEIENIMSSFKEEYIKWNYQTFIHKI